jgi:hypothetical protein
MSKKLLYVAIFLGAVLLWAALDPWAGVRIFIGGIAGYILRVLMEKTE